VGVSGMCGRLFLLFVIAALVGGGHSALAASSTDAASPRAAGPGADSPPTIGPGSNFTAADYDIGLKQAPALLARIGVACTVRQALYAGESTLFDAQGKTVGRARLYEVACEEGLGYLLDDRGKEPAFSTDCITGAQSGRIACMLPLNSHPAGGLDPYLKAAGVHCSALRARFIGQNLHERVRAFEVACGGGGGYILDIPLADGSGPAPSATPCFEAEDDCRFTPHVENVALLAFKVGKSFGEGCRIGDARYVGHVAARNDELYEVSCQKDHDGQLIEVDQTGGLKSSTDCSKVKLVGSACQLKPVETVDPLVQRAEAAGVETESPVTVRNPSWLRKPTGDEFARVYPRKALVNRVSGRAALNCRVTVTGALETCVVIDEGPVGFGFGAAALKMSSAFVMRPETVNGVPVTGAQVNIPIVFGMR
jgi:TonB family protein